MLANSSKYAVKAVRYLVNNASGSSKQSVKDIAGEIDVPKPFLSKLLQQLSSKNLISSTKGPGGGFYITDEQMEHSILNVIVEVEGKDRLKQCALNLENCDDINPCCIHHLIAKQKEALHRAYFEIKIKDLKS
ncbi:Rrf2 family transcriptional regulator [Aureitalea sp. L0-47]|uniref:RrF2 family transcriptional regulator n=1 Tax=Aureitalea sp. L0-47 TaxID=2816962 RepID=UPI002237C133|nr:Rrf2 family transcriptional regulator [Aureitalea sp. L0-47]MCW5518590.1 Rrf2 family transcriptional regulator [Aureitalea sp. L0-47]